MHHHASGFENQVARHAAAQWDHAARSKQATTNHAKRVGGEQQLALRAPAEVGRESRRRRRSASRGKQSKGAGRGDEDVAAIKKMNYC